MSRADDELRYAELVKAYREQNPIVTGLYHSLDVIDTKSSAILGYLGTLIVGFVFLLEFAAQNLSSNAFASLTFMVALGAAILAALILLSCLNLIGPGHRRIMQGLEKFEQDERDQQVVLRIADIASGRRRRCRFALRLAALASIGLLGAAGAVVADFDAFRLV
ncbi:MAG: hypothetical protein RKE49_00835 [Oceanicaulis sp.]